MSKSRIPTWGSLVLLGVGLLAVGIPGLWVYMSLTATKVHPEPRSIPFLTSAPSLPADSQNASDASRRFCELAVFDPLLDIRVCRLDEPA